MGAWEQGDGVALVVAVALSVGLVGYKANGPRSGVFWLRPVGEGWEPIDIGGPEGVKFDRIELLDLDGDGDLDLLTCEERENRGVMWYETPIGNPTAQPK